MRTLTFSRAANAVSILSICCIGLITGTAFAQSDKPNILIIMGDDVGITNISAYSRGLSVCDNPLLPVIFRIC